LRTINELSDENRRLYHSLLRADKLAALGTIAAGMAHEIKNPLASVKGLTQVLPENLEDKEFIRKYSEIVPRQLDRINRIVEDLLAFGHPKELEAREFAVEELLKEALSLVENQYRKAGIEVNSKIEPALIMADPERMMQAFLNIILNAIQAMPGGGKLTIEGKALLDDRYLLKIADNGHGIPADKIQNIFDPFFTTKQEGSGMGLAVTYRIIKEHQGEIEVESAVGKGTVFKLCLPIKLKPSV
jgi:signal transduction histidine kinase